ncbi:MAG: class I SAM-dependent methyltransferase, partial [Candidatus Lokiarchaeota archaeon]
EKTPKFPQDYSGEKAKEYDSLEWMERNQKRTTEKCIKFLIDENLGKIELNEFERQIVLDLGCGTGYSTEILVKSGFRVVGVEILEDMLIKALPKKLFLLKENEKNFELLMADIRYLPFRKASFDYGFSISAYNFIIHEAKSLKEKIQILNKTARFIYKLLKSNARLIIEFYPKNNKELNLFIDSFINNGFNGFMVKGDERQKAGQTYLLLKKEETR